MRRLVVVALAAIGVSFGLAVAPSVSADCSYEAWVIGLCSRDTSPGPVEDTPQYQGQWWDDGVEKWCPPDCM